MSNLAPPGETSVLGTERSSRARTLPTLIAEGAQSWGASPAVIFEDRVVSYAELSDEVDRVAAGLLALGVKHGDRVAVLFGNRPEWLFAGLGAASIGAVVVPLNTWYRERELRWTMAHCAVSVALSAERFLKQSYAELMAGLVHEGSLSAAVLDGGAAAGTISWEELLACGSSSQRRAELAARRAQIRGEDTAFILYTSGSSAEPKGVRLLHEGLLENGRAIAARRRTAPGDRIWLGAPLFYGLGAANALPVALSSGASLVIHDHFEAGRALEAIERHRPTVYYGTGNMTRAILDHPSFARARVASLERGLAGIGPDYRRLTILELGVECATPAYGLTESYGHVTGGWPDDPLAARLNTEGEPLPGVEIEIVDPETRRPLARGEAGLILLRGWLTPGYHDNPVETAKALLSDGRFDTGDLGLIDTDGRLVFRSRLKDVIKSGGVNVSPLEVEQLILEHPDIRSAYVVGIGDHLRGESLVAFVDAVSELDADAVRTFVKARAASFKVPQHVIRCSEQEVPRLASGKVAKRELVERAERAINQGGSA
jgi:fatty-acyl-CoA synthase